MTAAVATDRLTSTIAEIFGGVLEVNVGTDDDFFQLGGTSLGMFALLQRIEQCLDVNLVVTAIMQHPTPRMLADAIQLGHALDDNEQPCVEANALGVRPASRVQEAVLVASAHAASHGFLTWVYQLNGPLNVTALAAAIDDVVRIHEVLRTRFERSGDRLDLRVLPFTPGWLQRISMEGIPKAEAITAAVNDANRRLRGLRPEHEPMFQATLHEIDRKTAVFAMFVAEALVDSDSATIVASEITRAYAARTGAPLPPGVDAEGAVGPGSAIEAPSDDASVARASAHWASQPDRFPDLGTWPLAGEHAPTTVTFTLDETEWAGVARRAQSFSATPYVFLLACLQLAFAEVAGTRRLLVNAAVAHRRGPDAARMIGAFQIPIRIETDLEPAADLAAVVEHAKAGLRTALEHCAVPAPLADRAAGRTAPVPAIDFHMFDSHVGPLFAGVRRRRFRLHSDLHREPLLVKSIAGPMGRQDFAVSSATASPAHVEALAAKFRELLEVA